MRMVGGHTVDMHYVPMRYLQNYTIILKVFFKHLVYAEAAIITALVDLEDRKETQVMSEKVRIQNFSTEGNESYFCVKFTV